MYEVQVYLKTGAGAMFSFKDKAKAEFFQQRWNDLAKEHDASSVFEIVDEYGKKGSWWFEAVFGVVIGDVDAKLDAEIDSKIIIGRAEQRFMNRAKSEKPLTLVQ